jgi:hypothetical protein
MYEIIIAVPSSMKYRLISKPLDEQGLGKPLTYFTWQRTAVELY